MLFCNSGTGPPTNISSAACHNSHSSNSRVNISSGSSLKNINLNISKHLKTSNREHSIHCSIYLVSSSPYYSSRQWSCGRLKVGVSQKRFFFHLVPIIHYTKRSVILLSSTEDNPQFPGLPFNGGQGGCWEGESASESSRKFLLAPRQLRSHRGSRAETWTMLRFVPGSLQCILGHYRLFV